MQKLKSYLKVTWLLVFLLGLMSALPVGSAVAAGSNSSSQPTVTQAYATKQPLEVGMIVGLDPNHPTEVEPLTSQHIQQMQGVVVPASAAPVTISSQTAANQVFVATLGRYDVLVSDQNGPINTGDYITISSLAGIGMKASSSSQLVVGKAAGGFDGKDNVLGNDHFSGQNVNIGLVPVDLGIAHNPIAGASNQLVGFTFLQQVAHAITGKDSSPPRIYAALAIFVIIALIAAAVLYSGVRGGMVATGRNPLAKAAINRSLFEVVMAAVVIFAIGIGAIYLILKL